jgi:translation initiation factor IF-3
LSKKFNKFYRINQYIQAEKVRVVDEKTKQVGVMTLQEALEKAREARLDLVEIAPKAIPPVCKIIDFKKFKYLEAKKEKEEKRKSKKTELKEIRLGLFMAENDFNFRLNHAIEFLKEGHKVKVSLKFKGRQAMRKNLGYQLLQKALARMSSFAQVDVEPKLVGPKAEMVLSPLKAEKKGKGKGKEDENEKEKNKN